MFERFTDPARRVVVFAQEEARFLNHNHIGTEHILLGLIREGNGVGARALESLGISLDDVRRQVEGVVGVGETFPSGHIPFTPRGKKVLELALREALTLGHKHIGTEHILLGLVRENEGVAAQVLQRSGAGLDRIRHTVMQLLSEYGGEVREPTGEASTEDQPPSRAGADFPLCPHCSAPLRKSLQIQELVAAGEPGPARVRVVYCAKCGWAIGTVP